MNTATLYLIYDGDCILCRESAKAIQIKKAVGHLEIINARTPHPLVNEALQKGFDLNEGILVYYQDQYYYGAEALRFLALVSSQSNLFNKINAFIFKHKSLTYIFYPFFKMIRNFILRIRNVSPLPQPIEKPLIEKIFSTEAVHPLFKKRYLNRAYSNDRLMLKGEMNVYISKVFKILSPLFRLTGGLVPYPAEGVPVTVEFLSDKKSERILMRRKFYYKNRKPYYFCSDVVHIKDNLIIEKIRFGFACKLRYYYTENKITMQPDGYALYFKKHLLPIPLGFLIGKLDVYEEVVSDNRFKMAASMHHFLFGKIFQYDGFFELESS